MPIRPFRIMAHRGARITSPENTLASLARAKAEGVDAIEFDVRLSADSEPFIFHDESARRVTGSPVRISMLAWKDIRPLRAFGSHPIPHLEDVLKALEDWPGAELYLDLHQTILELPAVVAARVRKSRVRERVFILDFYTNRVLLRRSLETAPEVGISVMPGPPWWADRSCDLGAKSLCLGWDSGPTRLLYRAAGRFYDVRAAVMRARARGVAVSAGVANTEADIEYLLGQGIEAIWTDDLLMAKRVLSRAHREA